MCLATDLRWQLVLFSHTGQAWNRKLITPSLYSQSIIYGNENYIQRKLVQWLSFFLCAASCYKAGELIFSRMPTSSRIPLSLDVFIKEESGSSTGEGECGDQANYLGVLYNLKFLNSLKDKPTWRGAGSGNLVHRWPLKEWEGGREDGTKQRICLWLHSHGPICKLTQPSF